MAEAGEKAKAQFREITECSICMSAFTDPRMLPCIHTFCFECLHRTGEAAQKKPGDKLSCPLCRKDYTIPADGVNGVQKNFFMENLLQFKLTLESNDPNLKIGSETREEIRRMKNVKFCTKHTQKPLDYYCADCKKVVCVSCFVESHKSHDCKDVTTVDEEFRQTIEKKAWNISNYADEIMSIRKNIEKRNANFLKDIDENENSIHKRNQQLKDMIDRDTKSLLDESSAIKSKHLKEVENQMEEIERCCIALKSFEVYSTELKLKGSASDICSSVDQLIARADDLERDHEAFIGRPLQSVEVSFQGAELGEVLPRSNKNFVGHIKETIIEFENCAVLVGLHDGATITKDVIKINLQRPNDISTKERIPTTIVIETVAAVYCNTMYVTGVGANKDGIWKYNSASGWMKCASLFIGRRRHSAAFIDEVLYICGGFSDYAESVLDSVEAYNAVTHKCTTVGKLVHCVKSSGNCVPFKSALYIFGGSDKDNKALDGVQVYNTEQNTCTLLSKPLPRPFYMMQAALWETSVILLADDTCFIFNFETETWQEREQFKTDVDHFGLVLENGRIFVIGGGICETIYGDTTWKCRDDIRYVPLQNILDDEPIEWKIHAKLPQPALVHICSKLTLLGHSTKPNACLVQ